MKPFQLFLILIMFCFGLVNAQEAEFNECEIQNLKCIQTKLLKGEYRYEDLSRQSSNGKTSLHYAIEAKNLELVKLILTNNSSLSGIADNHGNTPLHRAVLLNQKQIVEYLLQYNSDSTINKVDRNSETALDIANASGYTELAEYLVGKGAQIGKGTKSTNATLWVYAVYVIISIVVTIWVARTLSKNGRIFLLDAFHSEELADSVNHLLVVGFYLVNLGYITIALKIGIKPTGAVEALEILSFKIGLVILLLGFMHFFNLYLFGRLRKRTLLKKELGLHQNLDVVRPTS